jgi:cytochrome c-type biogenesis protein
MLGLDVIDAALVPALLVAVAAGVLSFLSPCVLPIVPPYLAYMGGISLNGQGNARGRALLTAAFFVLGLSTVFLFLGFTFSWIGQLFLRNQMVLAQVAGVVIYVFGLHFIGLRRALPVTAAVLAVLAGTWLVAALTAGEPALEGLGRRLGESALPLAALVLAAVVLRLLPYDRLPFLDREARIDAGDRGGSAFGAYVLGLAFAFGWTPCIGPILGAILSLAATESSVTRGTSLLAAYAVGLGLPFLLVAGFLDRAQGLMRRMRPHMGRIEVAMGLLLVIVGVAMAVGAFTAFSWWLLETFPALSQLG